MKRRMLSVVLLAGGLMALSVTGASARTYCSIDPTYNIGLPVHYSINLNVDLRLAAVNLYLIGTSHTTTYGGGLGLLP
jgi:hypothetical protein